MASPAMSPGYKMSPEFKASPMGQVFSAPMENETVVPEGSLIFWGSLGGWGAQN